MIKLVLMDIDDTLCLTEGACFDFENHIAKLMGQKSMSRDSHRNNWGKPLQVAIAERIPGIDAKVFMEYVGKLLPEFIKDGKMDILDEANLKILDEIKSLGKKLGIVTSRSLPEVLHFLHEDHLLQSRIDAFYHKDNSPYLKPHPKVFDEAIRFFQIDPQEAVYVGDSLSDAQSANGAGLKFIAVLESGIRPRGYFNSVKVDYFAPKFTDIINYIKDN